MTKRISPWYETGTRLAVTASAQDLSNALWKNAPTMILSNIGTDWIYVRMGGLSTNTPPNVATTSTGHAIAPNTQSVITKAKDVFFLSVIGAGVGSTLLAMASGEGV